MTATSGSGHRRLPGWVLVGVALGLLVTAGAVTAANWPSPIDRGTVPRLSVPLGLAAPSAVPGPAPVTASGKRAGNGVALPVDPGPLLSGPVRPLQLIIPRFHVDAPVTPELVSAQGSLGVPDDPKTVGWWAAGPEPGSAAGTSVIDGHVDTATRGAGALIHLQDLVPGDQLAVRAAGGSERFRVDAVRQYPKTTIGSAKVFDQGVGGRLAVVTCGGPFDSATHAYRDNVVVFATPTAG